MDVLIREETNDDQQAVYAVEAAAFEREDEAQLVEKLRNLALPLISLVAEVGGQVVGHILFSPIQITNEAGQTFPGISLGPLAVLPDYQNQQIGSQLCRAGLEACCQAGHGLVFVLGHPTYYPRFGFEVTRPWGITSEFEVQDEAFMVAVLRPGALDNVTGVVRYHPVFRGV